MIHVIATIHVAAGKRSAVLAEMEKLVPQVRAENGCLEYGPAIDVETGLSTQEALRADVIVMVEKWQSVDALKTHLTAPHMNAYRAAVKDHVKEVKLVVLQPAGA